MCAADGLSGSATRDACDLDPADRNMADDAETISLHESTNGQIVQVQTPSEQSHNRVSPRYQALLLLSGFLMIFHVIGINQTYGIFQV